MKELKQKSGARKIAFLASALLALFLSAGVAAAAAVARAQDEGAAAGARRESEARRRGANNRGLLRILNLTPEQRARIGAIRRETELQGRLLGARLREARGALDEAIYAASPDDGIIEERVRELGAAQTAVVRLRSLTELRIRRVLSPEQLDAFRRLREQTGARRRRVDQLSPRGDLPPGAPARFRDRRARRRQEAQEQQEQQQQQRLSNDQNVSPSAPRGRRSAPSRDGKP